MTLDNAALATGLDSAPCIDHAVNRRGDRIGKGAGYSDLEIALLHEAGLLGPDTIIATTVHPLQVLEEELAATDHDFQVDLIVTPDQAIKCCRSRRHTGIQWDRLPRSTSAPSRFSDLWSTRTQVASRR